MADEETSDSEMEAVAAAAETGSGEDDAIAGDTDGDAFEPAMPGTLDPVLLDRMTGRLRDAATMEAQGRQVQMAAAPLFEQSFKRVTGLDLAARHGAIASGKCRDLAARFGENSALCVTGVKGLSDQLTVICGTDIVIALVDCLLGGASPDEVEITTRALSDIELDMSLMVFEQFMDAMRLSCSSDTKIKATTGRPMATLPEEDADPLPDDHSTAIRFELELGPIVSHLTLIVPQSALAKLKINAAARREAASAKGAWAERLSERVQKSEVGLKAAIALEPLKLSDVSRLVPGDVLPFLDTGDAGVMLSANGMLLYRCALGRTGQRYMVRVEGPAGAEEDWRKAIG